MPEKDRHVMQRVQVTVGDLWVPFGKAAGDTRRSEVIRAFIRWYLRRPGATLPQRPPEKSD